jgi:HEAT repeat protein
VRSDIRNRLIALPDLPSKVSFLASLLEHAPGHTVEIPSAMEHHMARMEAAVEELLRFGPGAVPHLVALLERSDGSIAENLAGVLIRMGAPVIPHLAADLEHGYRGAKRGDLRKRRLAHRTRLVYVLGKVADPQGAQALVQIMREDEEWSLRGVAAIAYARLPMQRLVNALCRRLQDRRDPQAGLFAREVLRRCCGQDLGFNPWKWQKRFDEAYLEGVLPSTALLECLEAPESSPAVRRWAYEVLHEGMGGELPADGALWREAMQTKIRGWIRPLLPMLEDKRPEVRQAAQEQMVKLTGVNYGPAPGTWEAWIGG